MNTNLNHNASASQKRNILNYLLSGKHITQLEALRLFGCFRLASRISDLRKDGYDIKVDRVLTPTNKWVASYSLTSD